MTPPQGYSKALPGQVCKLKRSLYGLKQASRQWNIELKKFLLHSLGFIQSKQDFSMFTKKDGIDFTVIVAYVDDLLISGSNHLIISHIKSQLHQAFTIKDLGDLKFFLGIEVHRTSAGILLNQRKYILDLLQDTRMENCKISPFPLPKGLKLSTLTGDLLANPESYRRLIGKLLYLNMTRPDISYSVQQLSQFLSAPRAPHFAAALHVMKYLKGSLNTGLFYSSNIEFQLQAYSDADWGTCAYSGKSLTGYCVFLGSSLISWKTKKQKVTSKSSTEAEYRSMSQTTSEIVWLEGLLQDLDILVPRPISLFCDNKSAQYIAENEVFLERTKHLKLDCHYIRDHIVSAFISLSHINSSLQLADLMTKPLGAAQHKFLCSKIGLLHYPSCPS